VRDQEARDRITFVAREARDRIASLEQEVWRLSREITDVSKKLATEADARGVGLKTLQREVEYIQETQFRGRGLQDMVLTQVRNLGLLMEHLGLVVDKEPRIRRKEDSDDG
jgi:hypothetical protein